MASFTEHYIEEHRIYLSEDDPLPAFVLRKDTDDTAYAVYHGENETLLGKWRGDLDERQIIGEFITREGPGRPDDSDDGPYHIDDPRSHG